MYLISTGPVYITDPNEANTVAGGGVFFRTESLDPFTRKGKVGVKVQVANQTDKEQKVRVQAVMTDPKGWILPGRRFRWSFLPVPQEKWIFLLCFPT